MKVRIKQIAIEEPVFEGEVFGVACNVTGKDVRLHWITQDRNGTVEVEMWPPVTTRLENNFIALYPKGGSDE